MPSDSRAILTARASADSASVLLWRRLCAWASAPRRSCPPQWRLCGPPSVYAEHWDDRAMADDGAVGPESELSSSDATTGSRSGTCRDGAMMSAMATWRCSTTLPWYLPPPVPPCCDKFNHYHPSLTIAAPNTTLFERALLLFKRITGGKY